MRYRALLLILSLLPVQLLAAADRTGVAGRHVSDAFAYEIDPPAGAWAPWPDLAEDYANADVGFLSVNGYGAVVMPVCWQGEAPSRLALLDVFLARFGEDYPTPFIHTESEVSKGDAQGRYLLGNEEVDGSNYAYHFWVVANDNCAYSLAAWGPSDDPRTAQDLHALWGGLKLSGSPAITGNNSSNREKAANAFFLNRLGTHYFEARSYRDAFRFLSQASDLDTSEPAYAMNALRVLVE